MVEEATFVVVPPRVQGMLRHAVGGCMQSFGFRIEAIRLARPQLAGAQFVGAPFVGAPFVGAPFVGA